MKDLKRIKTMICRYFNKTILLCVLCFLAALGNLQAQVLTLPAEERPEWLKKEGMIMAGSIWEPLSYRTRQGATGGHVPTAEERAAWEREHSPEVTRQLKEMGVNFIMMHCYKGSGLEIEKEYMQDAVLFAKHYHDEGLHVGVYACSGAFLWEPFYRENHEAQNWAILDKDYKPIDYYNFGIRYYWDRNNPNAQAFYKKIVNFAVKDIKADLLHFDNYSRGPGRDFNSIRRFQDYLRNTFTPEEREKMGAGDLSTVIPPMNDRATTMLDFAWMRFRSESLADSYKDMCQYARTLRKDILMELNCGEPGNKINWINHGQQLQGGEAFWSEGLPSGYRDGKFVNRIVGYKIARSMNNLAFFYANTPLSMAESMAFNSDCLGMVCGFPDGKIVSPGPDKEQRLKETVPYIRFYKTRRELFRDSKAIADVAVLRSYSSQVFSDPENASLTARTEQYCINNRIPFRIMYDNHLDDLNGCRFLALAGCVSLSDVQIKQILQFVERGGKLCVIGNAGTHNEWMVARKDDVFGKVPGDRIVRTDANGDIGAALLKAAGGKFSGSVTANDGVFAEYTSVPGKQLVHLVNYRPEQPVKNITVTMQVPEGKKVKQVLAVSPEQEGDQRIRFSAKNGAVSFTVPEVRTYDVAVLEFANYRMK